MRGVGETFFVSKQALRFLGPSAQGRRNARVKASLRSTSRNICMDGLFTSKPRMMWARTLYICGLKKGTVYGHVCNDHAGGPSMYIYLLYIYRILYVIHSVLRWNEILTTKRTDMGIARRLNVRKLFNELQSSGSLGNQHLWHCLDSSHAPAGTIGQSENSKCKWLGWGALECHLRSATSSSSWECLWWNQKKGVT